MPENIRNSKEHKEKMKRLAQGFSSYENWEDLEYLLDYIQELVGCKLDAYNKADNPDIEPYGGK